MRGGGAVEKRLSLELAQGLSVRPVVSNLVGDAPFRPSREILGESVRGVSAGSEVGVCGRD